MVPVVSSLLAMSLSAQSPPQLLQVVQERLNVDAEQAYGKIEEELARFCARMNCPNSYLALASVTLPREVWWLNAYASQADVDRVAQSPPAIANDPATHRSLHGSYRRAAFARGPSSPHFHAPT